MPVNIAVIQTTGMELKPMLSICLATCFILKGGTNKKVIVLKVNVATFPVSSTKFVNFLPNHSITLTIIATSAPCLVN